MKEPFFSPNAGRGLAALALVVLVAAGMKLAWQAVSPSPKAESLKECPLPDGAPPPPPGYRVVC